MKMRRPIIVYRMAWITAVCLIVICSLPQAIALSPQSRFQKQLHEHTSEKKTAQSNQADEVAQNSTTLDPNSYRIAIENRLLNEDTPQVQGYRVRAAEFPALERWLALRVQPKDVEVPVGVLQRRMQDKLGELLWRLRRIHRLKL